ncbi:MAG: hypothetical protein WAX79_08175, partial [Candidatus Omnitrophota bacterium]
MKGGLIEVKNKPAGRVFNPWLITPLADPARDEKARLILVVVGWVVKLCLNLGNSCAIVCHRVSHHYYFWLHFNYRP